MILSFNMLKYTHIYYKKLKFIKTYTLTDNKQREMYTNFKMQY